MDRTVLHALATTLLLATAASPGYAQTASDTGAGEEPPPSRSSRVWITELILALPGDDDLPVSPSAEWGLLWNLSNSLALGAVGTFRHQNGLRPGIEPRLRWWVGERTALDVGGGIRAGDRRYSDDLVPTAHAGISLWGDLAGVMVHLEHEADVDRASGTVEKRLQPYVGGFVGSGIGLLGTGIAAAAWAAVILLL